MFSGLQEEYERTNEICWKILQEYSQKNRSRKSKTLGSPSASKGNAKQKVVTSEAVERWNAEEANANAAKQVLQVGSDQRLSLISGLISSYDSK